MMLADVSLESFLNTQLTEVRLVAPKVWFGLFAGCPRKKAAGSCFSGEADLDIL